MPCELKQRMMILSFSNTASTPAHIVSVKIGKTKKKVSREKKILDENRQVEETR